MSLFYIVTVIDFRTKLLKNFATICKIGHITNQNGQLICLCYVLSYVLSSWQLVPSAGQFVQSAVSLSILRFNCHFPFVFSLRRIFRHLQVVILPTPENVKRHTTGRQRPILNCSLQLWLTEILASGFPRHPAHISTGLHFCQSELLGTVKNTVFSGRWCGVCPNLLWVVSNHPWVEISFCPTKYFLSEPTGSHGYNFLEPWMSGDSGHVWC